jgi:hypothetical protein
MLVPFAAAQCYERLAKPGFVPTAAPIVIQLSSGFSVSRTRRNSRRRGYERLHHIVQ